MFFGPRVSRNKIKREKRKRKKEKERKKRKSVVHVIIGVFVYVFFFAHIASEYKIKERIFFFLVYFNLTSPIISHPHCTDPTIQVTFRRSRNARPVSR